MARTNDHLQLDPSLEGQLGLDTFEGKFDVKDFVGSLSEKLISQSKTSSGPFDPKPFIRTFELVVDRLISVRKDVQVKTEQLEKNVRVAEREYSGKMAELNKGFEAVGSSFATMESKLSEVGRTAVRIGEELESVHVERQRAQAAHNLIDFYNQFSRGETSRLDALRKEGKDGRHQVAVILRRLTTLAKEVDLPIAEKTRENIDKYCEKFEKDMLFLFDRYYRKGDPKMMHHCAQTLLDFNGGGSCVQVYVNQHDFFINKVKDHVDESDEMFGYSQFIAMYSQDSRWKTISHPDSSPPKTAPGLVQLFAEIRATMAQESQIVQAVFPNPSLVMQVFLQRVFAQSIQQYMEQLLSKGASSSELAYLRVLQLIHVETSTLVDDLKTHELPSMVASKSSMAGVEFRRSLTGAPSNMISATTTTVAAMLEAAMEELFVPYIESQKYLERESKNMAELYATLLANFSQYHARTQRERGKASVFDRMVDRLGAAAANTSAAGPTTSAQAAAAIMRFGGMRTDRAHDKAVEEPLREEDGLLSIDTAEKMLKWHAEAVGRSVELSAQNDVPKNTFILLRVLAEAIANSYLEVAIESALARIDSADPKVEPSLQAFTVIYSVDAISHLWQRYMNIAIFPLAAASVTTRREMSVFVNQTISRMEGAVNNLLQPIISWLTLQLSKQKRNDFKPRNDDQSFARVNTEPCITCCEVLEKVRDAVIQNISGKNREAFLTEIGISFHSLLLDHLRKFPVSATGGLMLAKDLKSYQDIIASFNIPPLVERFEFIRQLGNVFLVRPEILRSYITDKLPWAHRLFENQFNESSEADDGVADMSNKGLKDRFRMGRLSTMMKELESLKIGEGISMALPSGIASGFPVVGRS
ncbi:exocyst complex component Sec10-domain-containing protein [Pisolithus orientalis]|uniref:exocyst complex component Sec10-domain-containing protein n=1 Tax=Pisolithus orientalis TaxID=936130 RepID=UPI0022242F89|nr:exocyst complex component Sec10-domain-containing protein [Pisolithus orientalis]KAI6035077.1 exocyst complex component Sec10-domain-containing protein [Pisolithus orientalis]